MAQKKRLMRSKDDRKFLGVCAGLGRYFGIDPLLVRLLFAVATVGGLGSAIPIYIILAFVMPEGDPQYDDELYSDIDFEESARTLGEDVVDAVRSATDTAAGVADDVIVRGRTAFGSAAHTLADAIDPKDAKDAVRDVADAAGDLGDDVSESVKRAIDRATDGMENSSSG